MNEPGFKPFNEKHTWHLLAVYSFPKFTSIELQKLSFSFTVAGVIRIQKGHFLANSGSGFLCCP
jgi:hypothetical protein